MRKPSSTLWAAALVLLLLPSLGKAELVIEITGGAEAALPVAIVPFGWEASGDPPEDVAGVITTNLERSGQFTALPREDFIETPSRRDDVRFQNWRALGVDNLVVGNIERDGDDYRVRYELLDVFTGERLIGKSFRVGSDALRTLAHVISDEIYESLLGRPGAFNTRIAYVAMSGNESERQWKLVLADADGYDPQTILTSREPLMSPDWSPDGRELAYVSFENRRSEVFVQDVASGEREKVASYEGINSAPSWSPDGNSLALALTRGGQTDIYVIDVDSKRLRQVTNHYSIDTEPVWMPDGKSVLFTSDRAGGPQIYRIGIDGSDIQRLTYEGNYNASPTVSPDGKRLAMVHRVDGRFAIAVQELEGERFRVMTPGGQDESPSFAPNGALVLYATRSNGRALLGTVSLFGEARRTMSTEGERIREPAWSR
ncbi:MAG: Tol-Pal system beta propeller repeat protein TolB [Aquisalimonadaceae bacterium]